MVNRWKTIEVFFMVRQRFFILIFALVLGFVVFLPSTSFAEEILDGVKYYDINQAKEEYMKGISYGKPSIPVYFTTEQKDEEEIRDLLEEISRTYPLNSETGENLIDMTDSSICNVALSNVSFRIKQINGKSYVAATFLLRYRVPDEERVKTMSQARKIANQIKANPSFDTDAMKVLAASQYLMKNVEYDKKLSNETVYTLDGALIHGKAVCQGYSDAMYVICHYLGIPCRIVFGQGITPQGESELHAWNIVKLGDSWYYLDTTWEDSLFSGLFNGAESKYVLKGTNSDFAKSHQADVYYLSDEFKINHPMSDEDFDLDSLSFMEKLSLFLFD